MDLEKIYNIIKNSKTHQYKTINLGNILELIITDECVDVYKYVDQLKSENDELKRLIAKQKNAKIQLSKLKDKQYKEFCDMKQTLIEIKEIAETASKCLYTTISDDYTDGYRWLGSIILQKISEVEDG